MKNKIPSPNYLKLIVHIAAISPLIWLIWAYSTNNLSVNPIQAATQFTGKYALIFLVITLAITPFYTLTGIRKVLPIRRMLGLYTFLYAAIHFFIFVGVDYSFQLSLVIPEIFAKRYTIIGLIAGFLLLALAITSFKWWMKYLGKNWKRLHQLIYLIAPLVVIHFAWARKGDILRLSGDVQQPLIFGAIVVILLIMRLPPVRKSLSSLKQVYKMYRSNSGRDKIQYRRNKLEEPLNPK